MILRFDRFFYILRHANQASDTNTTVVGGKPAQGIYAARRELSTMSA